MECLCFTVTNTNSTDQEIEISNCCTFTIETIVVPAGESITLFGEPGFLPPGVLVTENSQWSTCQECYVHNYKLYVYCDTIELKS